MAAWTGRDWSCGRSSRIASSDRCLLTGEVRNSSAARRRGCAGRSVCRGRKRACGTARGNAGAADPRAPRSGSAAVDGGLGIEPAHDQVRTAVVELLTDDTRRARHGRLAQVLASEPETEPQVLVTHDQEAGDHQAAFYASPPSGEPGREPTGVRPRRGFLSGRAGIE